MSVMDFAFSDAINYAIYPLVAGVFVALVLAALDIFLPHHGALDKY